MSPGFDRRARVAGTDGPRRHVLGDNGASADHSAISDRHPWMHKAFRREPSLRSHGNGFDYEREPRFLIVMCAAAQVRSLGYD